MAVKSSEPPPPTQNFPDIGQQIMGQVEGQLSGWKMKTDDGTDIADIATRATGKYSKGKTFSEIITETLDETDQSPSVGLAKGLTAGQRGYGVMEKVEKEVERVDMSRRGFCGLVVIGSLCSLYEGIFGGISKIFGGIFSQSERSFQNKIAYEERSNIRGTEDSLKAGFLTPA